MEVLEEAVREHSADIKRNSEDIRQNSDDIRALREEVSGLRHDFERREEVGRVGKLEARVTAIETHLGLHCR